MLLSVCSVHYIYAVSMHTQHCVMSACITFQKLQQTEAAYIILCALYMKYYLYSK